MYWFSSGAFPSTELVWADGMGTVCVLLAGLVVSALVLAVAALRATRHRQEREDRLADPFLLPSEW